MRLEQVEAEYGDGVTLEWRSFLLRPEPEARPLEGFRRYTESWTRPAALEPRARFHPWTTDAAPPSHSLPAAVAGKAAATFGAEAFRQYHRAVIDAYFAQNRTISDRAVLVAVAAESGLDAEAFDHVLTTRGRDLATEVMRDHSDALEQGIFAVPTVVIGDRIIPGAVDVDVYRRAITASCGA